MKNIKNKYWVPGVVVLLIACFFIFNSYIYNEKQSDALPIENTGTASESMDALPNGAGDLLGGLTYTRSTNAVDSQTRSLGVSFQYTTEPLCDSRATSDSFTVETGDGRIYPADCSGVVDHVYAKAGEYQARYLRNNDQLARVLVIIQ